MVIAITGGKHRLTYDCGVISRDKNQIADTDPTGEAEALEVDGTHTDQLDAKYRVRVAMASETDPAVVEIDKPGPTSSES